MTIFKQITFAALLFLGTHFASQVQAEDAKAGYIVIHQPWIRLSPGSSMASGYAAIENASKADDTLLSVKVDGVPDSQLHEMKMEGEVMKMNEIPAGLKLPAGATVQIWPKSSYHVMLMGMTKPLKVGDRVKGTFTFATAGKVEVQFEVMAPGSMPGMKMN